MNIGKQMTVLYWCAHTDNHEPHTNEASLIVVILAITASTTILQEQGGGEKEKFYLLIKKVMISICNYLFGTFFNTI